MLNKPKKSNKNDSGSPFFQFNNKLNGFDVIDIETGKTIPKYILWNKHGKSINDDTEMIMKRHHPGYQFTLNDDRRTYDLEKAIAINRATGSFKEK